MTPTVKVSNTTVSELWVSVGDITECPAVIDQIRAIHLGYAPNDFAGQKTPTKTHN